MHIDESGFFEKGNVFMSELVSALEVVSKYNTESKQHSSKVVSQRGKENPEHSDSNIHSISCEKIKKLYQGKLSRAGIEMAFEYSDKKEEPKAIFFQIQYPIKFAEYLSKIGLRDINEKSLELLSSILSQYKYDVENNADSKGDIKDLMIGADHLIEEYERLVGDKELSLIKTIEETKQYINWNQEGILEEKFQEMDLRLDFSLNESNPENNESEVKQWLAFHGFSPDPLYWFDGSDVEDFRRTFTEILNFMKHLKKVDEDILQEDLKKIFLIREYIKSKIEKIGNKEGYEFLSKYSEILEENYHKLKEIEFSS